MGQPRLANIVLREASPHGSADLVDAQLYCNKMTGILPGLLKDEKIQKKEVNIYIGEERIGEESMTIF